MTIFDIRDENDIVRARSGARDLAGRLGFSVIDKTRIATAVSELARNTLTHGEGGRMEINETTNGDRIGLRCVFLDNGPGIADIAQAMQDGFSSAGSLGNGLPGSRRLMDKFSIVSTPGKGTRVEIVKWM